MNLKLLAAVSFLAASVASPSFAQTGGLAGLYAAQPPAGSSFVRVVNASGTPLQILLGSVALQLPQAGTNAIASVYRVVDPARPLAITVNGRPVAGELKLMPNGFSTVLLSAKGTEMVAQSIVDMPEGQNALKAVLRAYNLVPQCSLTVSVANGPTVFDRIPFGENKARSINPIKATLVARCEQSETSLALPALSAGDKYSLFLIGDAAKPQWVGQFDQTEAYNEKR